LEFTCELASLQEEVFFLDLRLLARDGSFLAVSRYPFSRTHDLAPLLHHPRTGLEVSQLQDGEAWKIKITNPGSQAALFIWLEDARPLSAPGYAYFADNHFCLLPGESRSIRVDWTGVDRPERGVVIGGWNTDQLLITEEHIVRVASLPLPMPAVEMREVEEW
jgi:hypothetical protein